jgi:outer membrane lipoprotein SlyB
MKKLAILLGLALTLGGCARNETYPVGTEVTVEKKDGANVAGKLVEVKPEQIVLEARDGGRTEVPKSQIASLKPATPAGELPRAADAKPAGTAESPSSAKDAGAPPPVAPEPPRAPRPDDKVAAEPVKRIEYREVTVPSGTTLSVTLGTAIASDTSKVEDPVRATLKTPISIDGVQALPSGTAVLGNVTSAVRSAKVKGLASVGVRFHTVDLPGDGSRLEISTATITREANTTKKKDATKIGIGAGAGAVIGGIVGGGGGAAKGAAIGGGAGTAAVLATRGDEVHLPAGTPLSVKLTAPLTIRVPLHEK